MKIMKAKVHKWRLGAAGNVGSRMILKVFEFWRKNGVKMDSPLPFLNFYVRHARPGEQNFLSFFCKSLCKIVFVHCYVYIFSKIL